MKIEFSDGKYRFVHSKMPRGRGQWCFSFKGQERWEYGTLVEAKQKIKAYIKEITPKDQIGTVIVNIEP